MSTVSLPTNMHGEYYAGPTSAHQAAVAVLFESAGAYAEDEDGTPLSRDQLLQHFHTRYVNLLRRNGYPKAAELLDSTNTEAGLQALANKGAQ